MYATVLGLLDSCHLYKKVRWFIARLSLIICCFLIVPEQRLSVSSLATEYPVTYMVSKLGHQIIQAHHGEHNAPRTIYSIKQVCSLPNRRRKGGWSWQCLWQKLEQSASAHHLSKLITLQRSSSRRGHPFDSQFWTIPSIRFADATLEICCTSNHSSFDSWLPLGFCQ